MVLLTGALVAADTHANCVDRKTFVVCETYGDEGVHHLSGLSQIEVEKLWSHGMWFEQAVHIFFSLVLHVAWMRACATSLVLRIGRNVSYVYVVYSCANSRNQMYSL